MRREISLIRCSDILSMMEDIEDGRWRDIFFMVEGYLLYNGDVSLERWKGVVRTVEGSLPRDIISMVDHQYDGVISSAWWRILRTAEGYLK